MDRYAQLVDNVVHLVIESETDPDGINGEWIACTPEVGPGWTYDGQLFHPPVVTPPPTPAWTWYIDIGPFFDRFGPVKMAVLTCTDAGVRAIITDAQVRKWIDLQLPEVADSLAYISSKVPAVDATLITAILTTPVAEKENLALRKMYF